MEKTTYYKTLPDGYVPVKTVDAKDKKFAIWMNVAATLLMLAVGTVTYLLRFVAFPNAHRALRESMASLQDNIWALEGFCFGFVAAMLVYMVLHEVTHGIVYKLRTHEKLTFGVRLSCAYCGVPGIYATRETALLSLLAPFTVWNVVFIAAMCLTSGALSFGFLVLFASHFGGCAGDLYDTYLLLTSLKGDVLVSDDGPTQVFYRK